MVTVDPINPILARMIRPGKKKILSCDGGGIRGLISVEILTKLEQGLRKELKKPDLLLGDYFDLVCGTSTGGIIATCLACGMSMSEVKAFYVNSGEDMFKRAEWYLKLHYKYEAEPLGLLLQRALNTKLGGSGYIYKEGEPPVELGDERLHCLLMLVMHNLSTDSPWLVSNNPLAKYNEKTRGDCNLHLPLWQLVRASTAAPSFFPPEVVRLGEGTTEEREFVFVDGGITTYNSPTYLAFQMATARPYHVNWKTGADELLVVSVGTGNAPAGRSGVRPVELWLGDHAKSVPTALMNAATAGWDMVCRVLGECRFGGEVDREFGAMLQQPGTAQDDSNWSGPKQFAYVRYDPLTTQDSLNSLGLHDVREEHLARMDDVSTIGDLSRVGSAYAAANVNIQHLDGFVG